MYKAFKALLRAIFYRAPIVGKVYVFDNWDANVDPFKSDVIPNVEVLEVKNDFVKYKMLECKYFTTDSMKVNAFWFCYKEIE
jgi:hypothetical protein